MTTGLFTTKAIGEVATLVGGDHELAQKIAAVFEGDIRSQSVTVIPAARTSDEKKAIRKANLQVANERREEQWRENVKCVRRIILDAQTADPSVSLNELCVLINQACLPTYRPNIFPSWTPSMVRRFIRMNMQDAKPETT